MAIFSFHHRCAVGPWGVCFNQPHVATLPPDTEAAE
jgi:hypothetical protein